MKKFRILLAFLLVVSFALAACNNSEKSTGSGDGKNNKESSKAAKLEIFSWWTGPVKRTVCWHYWIYLVKSIRI